MVQLGVTLIHDVLSDYQAFVVMVEPVGEISVRKCSERDMDHLKVKLWGVFQGLAFLTTEDKIENLSPALPTE